MDPIERVQFGTEATSLHAVGMGPILGRNGGLAQVAGPLVSILPCKIDSSESGLRQ